MHSLTAREEYEKEREDLYEQKEQALIAGDLERVREPLVCGKEVRKENRKRRRIKTGTATEKDKILPSHIAQVVAKWTHIPVEQMEEAEKERLKNWILFCMSVSLDKMMQ